MSGQGGYDVVVLNGNTSVVSSITANSFPQAGNVYKGFEFYKYTKLNFTISPPVRFETTVPASTLSAQWALGYMPEGTNATPTTITTNDVRSLPDSIGGMCQVVNVNTADESATNTGKLLVAGDTKERVLRVRKSALNCSLAKMFRTQSATTGDPAVLQGNVIVAVGDAAGTNTVKFFIRVTYTIRFFEPLFATDLSVPRPPAAILQQAHSVTEDDEKSNLSTTTGVQTPPPGGGFYMPVAPPGWALVKKA